MRQINPVRVGAINNPLSATDLIILENPKGYTKTQQHQTTGSKTYSFSSAQGIHTKKDYILGYKTSSSTNLKEFKSYRVCSLITMESN